MAPEYAGDGLFSVKSDVFSFGILMLEIISGKKNRGFFNPDQRLNLTGHVSTSLLKSLETCYIILSHLINNLIFILGMETMERRKFTRTNRRMFSWFL